MRYGMAIDTKKCIGCGDCVVACQLENKTPVGYSRSWVSETLSGNYPQTQLEFRSERCNHCENAPCVRTCPTGASYYMDGGIVGVKAGRCIGCGACVESCPYSARYMSPEGVPDKCTFCDHRIVNGEDPTCVATCPTNCMYFGDLDDPQSDISKLLVSRKTKTLLPEVGTDPQIFYLT